jgi:hypothetical protein
MTRMQIGRWQLSLRTGIALLLGGIFTSCCPSPPAPPVPAGCPRGVAPSNAAELRACTQGLAFDPAPEVGDEQPLTVIGPRDPQGMDCPGDYRHEFSCRYGPRGRIEPLIGAHKFSDKALREGRIIARLSLVDRGAPDYTKLGLTQGTPTYWWVQVAADGKTGKSVFVTEARGGKEVVTRSFDLVYQDNDEEPKLTRAVARWIWTLEDEKTQGSCGSGTCK